MNSEDNTQTHTILTPGTKISHYRIVNKIGEGGMGEVYLAEDSSLDRKVALKFLPIRFSVDTELRTRFLREAQATARIDHPNIVMVHEIDEHQGRPFFVMSLVEGVTLKEYAQQNNLTIEKIIDIVSQIGEGLLAAHEKGVIHRDIKPSNVLIDLYGRARIVDFGLASIEGANELTKTGSTLGTFGYMSPEQIKGEKTDARSDLFSLGVIMYELISGDKPFKGENHATIINCILNETPPALKSKGEIIPEQVQHINEKLLEKSLKYRYQNVRDLIKDLKNIDSVIVKKSHSEKKSPTIAVLPFSNMSADKENEYFSDGITEEIINSLTQLKNLQVASRTSSFFFKDVSTDIKEVGEKLNVDTVLEGSVRRAGNRIRVTAQLINVSDGYHIWSEKYDRTMDDIFAIQDEIATTITEKLKVALSASEENAMISHGTDNMRAYDQFLRGKFYWEQRGNKLETGLQYFKQAVELDPNYAQAYVGIADTYHMMGLYGIKAPKQCMVEAKAAANKALEINDNLAEAYTALAMVSLLFERDWDVAKKMFNKAIELNPKDVRARYWYSYWYLYLYEGDTSASLVEGQLGIDIEPFAALPKLHFALILWMEKRFDEVLNILDKIKTQDPTAYKTYWWVVGCAYCGLNDFDKALSVCPSVEKSLKRHQWSAAYHGYILATAGKIEDARILQDELEKRNETSYVSNYSRSIIPIALGEEERALDILDGTRDSRDCSIIMASKSIMFSKIKDHPRFKKLLQDEGLKVI